jgi:hypothetical protein
MGPAVGKRLFNRTDHAFFFSSFVSAITKIAGSGIEAAGKFLVKLDQAIISILHRDVTGNGFEHFAVFIILVLEFLLPFSDFASHFVNGACQMTELTVRLQLDPGEVVTFRDLPSALDELIDGLLHEPHDQQKDNSATEQKNENSQADYFSFEKKLMPAGLSDDNGGPDGNTDQQHKSQRNDEFNSQPVPQVVEKIKHGCDENPPMQKTAFFWAP